MNFHGSLSLNVANFGVKRASASVRCAVEILEALSKSSAHIWCVLKGLQTNNNGCACSQGDAFFNRRLQVLAPSPSGQPELAP